MISCISFRVNKIILFELHVQYEIHFTNKDQNYILSQIFNVATSTKFHQNSQSSYEGETCERTLPSHYARILCILGK
jgi:hypothetical protein